MPDENDKKLVFQTPMMQTEGIPSLYANLASVSISFNDLRVYLGEIAPKEVKTSSGTGDKAELKAELRPGVVSPRICIVCSPEFARSLRDALDNSLTQYEHFFGPLRPTPEEKQLKFLLEQPKQ